MGAGGQVWWSLKIQEHEKIKMESLKQRKEGGRAVFMQNATTLILAKIHVMLEMKNVLIQNQKMIL